MSVYSAESITKYMATKLITFTPEVEINEAIKVIVKSKISGAPVINKKGVLVGMLSEIDCIKTILDGPYNQVPASGGTVSDFMTVNLKTIDADKTIFDAAIEFTQTKVRRLPVIDQGKLVGQISRVDILRAILKMKPKIKHVPSSWKGREPKH